MFSAFLILFILIVAESGIQSMPTVQVPDLDFAKAFCGSVATAAEGSKKAGRADENNERVTFLSVVCSPAFMAFSRELTPLWVCKTSEMDRTIAGICGNVTESFGDCNKGASIAKCTAMEYEKRCNLTNAPQLLSKYTQMFAETKIPEFTQCSDVIIKALLEE